MCVSDLFEERRLDMSQPSRNKRFVSMKLRECFHVIFRKKMSDDEAGIMNDERFQLELEFVQCLASPQYLQCIC